jgi:hypothetical protein
MYNNCTPARPTNPTKTAGVRSQSSAVPSIPIDYLADEYSAEQIEILRDKFLQYFSSCRSIQNDAFQTASTTIMEMTNELTKDNTKIKEWISFFNMTRFEPFKSKFPNNWKNLLKSCVKLMLDQCNKNDPIFLLMLHMLQYRLIDTSYASISLNITPVEALLHFLKTISDKDEVDADSKNFSF